MSSASDTFRPKLTVLDIACPHTQRFKSHTGGRKRINAEDRRVEVYESDKKK
jgi:hypothetical protein